MFVKCEDLDNKGFTTSAAKIGFSFCQSILLGISSMAMITVASDSSSEPENPSKSVKVFSDSVLYPLKSILSVV